MYGYAGKVLHVDLSTQKIVKKPLDLALARRFLGGAGIATKMLYDEVKPGVEPLGPDNLFIITVGPLVGTATPCAARVDLVSKSPLTGIIGLSNAGGYFASSLKMAGYDAVVIRGRSERPVYLWIDDDEVNIRSAEHLWLKADAWDSVDRIKEEIDERPRDIRIMCIGPGGENLVKYASVVFDRYHVAGRCGLGAVMGAKKLKAVAVRGTKRPCVARPDEFFKAVREAVDRIVHDPRYKTYREYASLPVSRISYRAGRLPGKNYQTTVIEGWEETRTLECALEYITPQSRVDQKEIGCFSCPIMCFHQVEVKEGKYKGLRISSGTFVMPIVEFGAKCMIDNLPAIWKCKELCHRLGLDQASAGACIAFAMEASQRGALDEKIEWGDEE
ncbi:MAG: aldehyde ferredoxin oxidoreductase N-terminal domain-containing protein, partial [Nitrososphaerota archaeon]